MWLRFSTNHVGFLLKTPRTGETFPINSAVQGQSESSRTAMNKWLMSDEGVLLCVLKKSGFLARLSLLQKKVLQDTFKKKTSQNE